MTKMLIPVEELNDINLFMDEEKINAFLNELRRQATDFTPDTTTKKGRKEIASQAYKVSQSKTFVDIELKALTTEWARKKKVVDSGRKTVREFCDNLRDEIRLPLTEWEEKEKVLAAIAAEKAEMLADEIEAYEINDLFIREKRILEAEAKIAEKEKEARKAILFLATEKERLATKRRLQAEAKKLAERKAQIAIDEANEKTAREKREREAEKETARLASIEDAKKAERDRLQAIKDTENRLEQERIERELQAKIKAEKEERKANQKRHVSFINKSVAASFIANGIGEVTANKIVELVSCESIDNISIDYLAAIKSGESPCLIG